MTICDCAWRRFSSSTLLCKRTRLNTMRASLAACISSRHALLVRRSTTSSLFSDPAAERLHRCGVVFDAALVCVVPNVLPPSRPSHDVAFCRPFPVRRGQKGRPRPKAHTGGRWPVGAGLWPRGWANGATREPVWAYPAVGGAVGPLSGAGHTGPARASCASTPLATPPGAFRPRPETNGIGPHGVVRGDSEAQSALTGSISRVLPVGGTPEAGSRNSRITHPTFLPLPARDGRRTAIWNLDQAPGGRTHGRVGVVDAYS